MRESMASRKRTKPSDEREKEGVGPVRKEMKLDFKGSLTKESPKKMFTSKEEKLIEDYFGKQIATRQFPSQRECREFLELFKLQRKPKDIYDKCRNLAGR